MTSKLRCPVCGGELVNIIGLPGCTKCNFLGNEYTRKALIRTQKQLEIARKALKEYANKDNWGCIEDDRDRFIHTYWYFDGCDGGGWLNAENALEQIGHKEK